MTPKVIYQDKDILIVNKPAGLLVHQISYKRQATSDKTLVDWLLENYPEVREVGDEPKIRPGIVHRLDKETSGIMVVALNQKAFDYLKNFFQTRQIKKTYLALVWGRVPQKFGTIDKPLGIKSGSVKRSVTAQKMVKEAKTVYKVIKFIKSGNADFTLLEVRPLTGRTHQIRVHLASIGHPVVGDKLYGRKIIPENLTRQFLHAEAIELTLPNGQRLKVAADLPKDLSDFLKALPASDSK